MSTNTTSGSAWKAVRYHLDNGKFTRAMLIREAGLPDEWQLLVDLWTDEGRAVIGKDSWFSESYVAAYRGLVPECAHRGTDPGEWSEYPQASEQGGEEGK